MKADQGIISIIFQGEKGFLGSCYMYLLYFIICFFFLIKSDLGLDREPVRLFHSFFMAG